MGDIRVQGLGKAFKQYASRWARLAEWLSPTGAPRHQQAWALRDITFTVEAGKALGLVGENGAGKSTLLKLITGTLLPTEGKIEFGGRVSALLELGMGFHPDFTGRQNAIMAGQLLGMEQAEIEALLPDIEAFAEIGAAIDQPVRTYSSGMQMRLAFSVATAQRPDILIVDEALSVGDTYFQHKSFDRIREFRRQGTTLLIVSHDRFAIQSICDEAILLQHGRLMMHGTPEAVLDYYHALQADREAKNIRQEILANNRTQTISGSEEASITSVQLLAQDGKPSDVFEVDSTCMVEIKARVNQKIPKLGLGLLIKDRYGHSVYGTNTHTLEQTLYDLNPGENLIFHIVFPMRLGPGHYSLSLCLSQEHSHLEGNYEWRDCAALFHVENHLQPPFIGTAWLETNIHVTRHSTPCVEHIS